MPKTPVGKQRAVVPAGAEADPSPPFCVQQRQRVLAVDAGVTAQQPAQHNAPCLAGHDLQGGRGMPK